MCFSNVRGLNKHKNDHCQYAKGVTHDTNRGAQCPGCDRIFIRKHSMRAHMLKCPKARKRGFHKEIEKTLKNKKLKKKKSSDKTFVCGMKTLAQCLMCLYWFKGAELEKHLWRCEAKRPCLNRIDEVKAEGNVEVKEEPTISQNDWLTPSYQEIEFFNSNPAVVKTEGKPDAQEEATMSHD